MNQNFIPDLFVVLKWRMELLVGKISDYWFRVKDFQRNTFSTIEKKGFSGTWKILQRFTDTVWRGGPNYSDRLRLEVNKYIICVTSRTPRRIKKSKLAPLAPEQINFKGNTGRSGIKRGIQLENSVVFCYQFELVERGGVF